MSAALLALLLQTATISGNLISPPGSSTPASAQVTLLSSDYAKIFNAEAQRRIDRYWETYKDQFAERKEEFSRAFAFAYLEALDITLSRMRMEGKANSATVTRTATGGNFEFRGVPPGDYKIIATSTINETNYVWTESVLVTSGQIFLQMKTRVP